MDRMKESYYSDIEYEIMEYLKREYYYPILDILQMSDKVLENSSMEMLLSAIRSGKIVYRNGVFYGTFNIRLSKELSKFATFDSRSKTWKSKQIPDEIISESVVANLKSEELKKKIDYLLNKSLTPNLQFKSVGDIIRIGDGDIKKEFDRLGIHLNLDENIKDRLSSDYIENQNLNIKNWTEEQTKRLREVVKKSSFEGFNRQSFIRMLQYEYDVTQNKAKFLARQETSLLMSRLEISRAERVGLTQYVWMTSHDERVRDSHEDLNGQTISLSSPPVVDRKTGRRAHAGEDFNCRCRKKWVIQKNAMQNDIRPISLNRA